MHMRPDHGHQLSGSWPTIASKRQFRPIHARNSPLHSGAEKCILSAPRTAMPTFSSKPLGRKSVSSAWTLMSKLSPQVRKHPVLLFGVPFVMTIVGGSYGLSQLTQTRYDYNATKVQTLSKEEELGMRKDRRKIDLREEYYVRGGARGWAERTTLTLRAPRCHLSVCRQRTRNWRSGSQSG